MQLNTFVQNYIPTDLRTGRDFVGGRGWVHIANLVLKQLERRGLLIVDRVREVGVEVSNDYWITMPSDCRTPMEVHYKAAAEYTEIDRDYRFSIEDGKIRLYEPFDKKASPDAFTLSAWATTGVSINDADATADLWNDYLLVITSGSLSGKTFLIADTAAAAGGVSALTFLHARGVAAATSTAGYLTDQFLMLKYMSSFDLLTAAADEVPIDNRFEDILAEGMILQATSRRDKFFKTQFEMWLQSLDEAQADEFTPGAGQRPQPRSLPGFENCDAYDDSDSDYIGDEG